MGRFGVPGVQVSVCVGDRPVRTLAWGVASRATGAAMREDTAFRMASMAKPVSSLVFLRLATVGVLRLDEPLNPWLHPFVPHLCEQPLTSRHLLSHRAGLSVVHPPHYPLKPVPGGPRPSLVEALRGENGAPAISRGTPTETCYTGAGWMLLEHVLGLRTGRSFHDLALEHLIRPLSLRSMSYEDADRARPGLADYTLSDGVVPAITTSPATASTGLVSDTRDIVVATRQLIDAARGLRPEFLPAAFAREAITPQPVDAAHADFTLTHFVFSRTPFTLTHGGVRPGFRSTMTVFPHQRIIACVATNSDQGFEAVKPWLGLLGTVAAATNRP